MNKNINVLLVDQDEQSLVNILESLEITNISYQSDASEALRDFNTNKYDITFLSTDLPGTAGLTLVNSIMEQQPSHYLVMLCEDVSPDLVQSGTKLGASGFITVPYTKNKVASELQKYELLQKGGGDHRSYGT